MTNLAGCLFLCLGLFSAADKAKVDSLDYGHASLVPVPAHSSSDKGRVDAKHSHQSWMDRFDAALRSLIIPDTVKIINAYDAGHEIEAGDLEGLRLKRESENDVKMKGVSENDEKRSAGEEKIAGVKKEKTKEINDKENKDKEVSEEKRVEEKNENVGKEQSEKRKTRQNIFTEEADADEFDTGNLKRSKFSDFKTDSKPYRSAEGVSYLEIKNDDAGNVEDEERNELENLMRQRDFKSRLAINNEDRRKERRKRRHHNNGNGGKFPRRYRKEAGDNNHSYRQRRYYDLDSPFHTEGEDSSMRRAYRDDALGGYDLRQRDRRHGDQRSKSRNRRRPDEDVDENDAAMRLDDRGYERLLRSSRNSETADSEDIDSIRNARGLKDMYDDVRTLLFDDEDASSEDEQRRFVRLSGSDEEDVGKDDERMKRGWAAGDEMVDERRRRSQDDEDDDDEENRLMRRSAVDGNAEGRGVDRQRQVRNDDRFYEQELQREAILGRGKRRRVWETAKRRPFEY